jgi:hypothetical protein
MRQVFPGLVVRAVVLADRAPLPLADVRAALVPLASLAQAVLEVPEAGHPLALGAHPAGCYLAAGCHKLVACLV